MSVRSRTWKGQNGDTKQAWVVDYRDQNGKRRIKTFADKRDADDASGILAIAKAKAGMSDRNTVSVVEAGRLWANGWRYAFDRGFSKGFADGFAAAIGAATSCLQRQAASVRGRDLLRAELLKVSGAVRRIKKRRSRSGSN